MEALVELLIELVGGILCQFITEILTELGLANGG